MNSVPRVAIALVACAALASPLAVSQETVVFTTEDGAGITADFYPGSSNRAIVLAHGGRYGKDSWRPQAKLLAREGYRVLAIDFRGYGNSVGPGSKDPLSAPLHFDILGAVRHLRSHGAASVAVVGGSLGGMAAGDAAIHGAGEIDRIVFLGAPASLSGADVSRMGGRKFFIIARDDLDGRGNPRLARIQSDHDRVPPPRELLVVEGAAHAQALFATPESQRVFDAILRFLQDPDDRETSSDPADSRHIRTMTPSSP